MQGNVKLPGNWDNFLKVDSNKWEQSNFLAICIQPSKTGDNVILSTKDSHAVTSAGNITVNLQHVKPCSYEEENTCIFLHVKAASQSGHQNVMIRTVNTAVLVLAISLFNDLGVQTLWIVFGTGKHYRYIAAHTIAEALGVKKARALRSFHAFTGCDQVSFFNGRGNSTAWAT